MTRKLCTVLIACLISSHNLLADNWLARISDNTYRAHMMLLPAKGLPPSLHFWATYVP